MISIFHGPNNYQSRKQLNLHIEKQLDRHTLRLNKKTIDIETINNFLNTISLLDQNNVLVLEDFFSIPTSSKRKKIEDILNKSQNQIFIWHTKKLTVSQLKTFPKAQLFEFNLSNLLFSCVYSIKPGNLKTFLSSYELIKDKEPFELILHLIKQNLRKQLTTSTPLDKNLLKKAYLNLIELDYQSKTGELSIDKSIALQRIIINLIN